MADDATATIGHASNRATSGPLCHPVDCPPYRPTLYPRGVPKSPPVSSCS